MTQKELLYVEDAVGHETNIISICKSTMENLQDENLKNFLEQEINNHKSMKDKLISMLKPMSDRLLLDNYLLVLKSTVEVYVHGTLESSNEDIKNLLKLGLDETMGHQSRTYNEMTKHGWYTINNIDVSNIKQTIEKLKKGN